MYITKEDFLFDLEHQSIEVPNNDGVRQSMLMPPGVCLKYLFEDTRTLVEILQRGCRVSNNGPCLGWRDSEPEYKWMSYWEVIEKSKHISYGLLHAGFRRGQQSFIGIFARNCCECVLIEHACYSQSAVPVFLYDTLGPTSSTFILNHVEAEFLFCDTEEKAKSILNVKEDVPKLLHIIMIHDVNDETKKLAAKKNVTLHTLKDIEELGRQNPNNLMLPSPSDLATICFSSGSTGNPKGAMLTHGNLVAGISAFIKHIGTDYLGVGCRTLSYLPMAHVFDKYLQFIMYINGGAVGMFRGDAELLLEDMSVLRPTVLPAVPRILYRIYDKVHSAMKASSVSKMIIDCALSGKQSELKRGIIRNNSMWDWLALKRIQNIFGGEVKLLITGGAPIRSEVLSFFKCSLGCAVVEVYGQTETGGLTNCTAIFEYDTGTVGPPAPSCFIKLHDVPEMGYYAQDGNGEILFKGPTIMKGYFKDPVRSAEVLDHDGWLHSGDIGKWTKNGALCVVGRKNNLVKLSQGEYVSLEKMENIYQDSPYVQQIFVHGESLESCLVAIIVPEKKMLTSWCSQQGILGDWKDICKNEVVKAHILEDMHRLGKEAELKGFEQVKAIHLHPEAFTQENNFLTATMKIKREECKRQFKHIIEKMYHAFR